MPHNPGSYTSAMVALLALALLFQARPETVTYSRPAGQVLKIDLYRPAKSAKPTAALLLVHGGGWSAGDKRDMGAFGQALAAKGFLCAAVQYRFAPKYRWPAQLDDVQTAVRYLRFNAKNLNIDPKRIGAVGASAGGHLAQFLGVRETRDPKPAEYPEFSSKVQAVWNIFGPVDFTQKFPDIVVGIVKNLLGKADEARKKDASPVFFAAIDSAPTFFLQGKKDPLVPWQQAQEMAEKLRSFGVEADLNLIDDMEHSPDMSKPEVAKAVQRGIDWLVKRLQ
jgi:acetyl esterase/lipase